MIEKEFIDSFSTREITIGQIALTLDGWSARTTDPEKAHPEKWETRTQLTFTFTGEDALKARAILEALIHGQNVQGDSTAPAP